LAAVFVVRLAPSAQLDDPVTAKMRVGVARRVGGSWREFAERRLGEQYFWKTVSRPHAICRLAIETVGTRRRPGSRVIVRLLLSPRSAAGVRTASHSP